MAVVAERRVDGLQLAAQVKWQEPVLHFLRARLPKLPLTK